MNFYKYHALGNDYLVVHPTDLAQAPEQGLIRRMCERHTGAGSDGLLLLPYFEGERTPNVPDGTGVWFGVNGKTFEAGHFAAAGNTGFEQGQGMLFGCLPNRKRDAHLGIVTFRTAHDHVVVVQELEKPFLNDGFSVAAGDAHHRQVGEPAAVVLGEMLEGGQGIGYEQYVGIGECAEVGIGL